MKKQILNFMVWGLFIFTIAILNSSLTFAQWSNDPASNLLISNQSGDQALPKIASTSDGGCYISWFDARSGSYAVYLQRLNSLGEKQFATDGLLISDNPQNSSLVDYDMKVDNENNAIITFTDIRDAGNLHVFAYKIDTAGNFLWGNNGVSLSGAGSYQANPVVVQSSDGNYIFAWIVASDTQKIALQKLSPTGTKMWGTDPIIYASGTDENYSYPRIVASDNGGAILVHAGYTGPFFSAVVYLYTQKFDTDGNTLWGANGLSVQNVGGIPGYEQPVVISDNDNGAIVTWYDDRDNNNLFSSFVQHINFDGSMAFPVNGSEGSTNAGFHHLNPTVAYLSSSGDLYMTWLEENSLQSSIGIYGQKFDASGNRQWTDNGKMFKAMGSDAIFGPYSLPADTTIYNFYLEGNASGVNVSMSAFMINSNGDFVWPGDFVTMSNSTPDKLHAVVTVSSDLIAKSAWEDTRTGDAGIYAQNINPNGALGNIITPVELNSFSANSNASNVNLKWETATETNNKGFEIERSLNKSNNWQNVVFVPGAGTSTEQHSYSYSDQVSQSGTYTYKLVQIDFNGSRKELGQVDVNVNAVPNDYALNQNYPNPFNPTTVISYQLPKESHVTLKVYDIIGNEVQTLVKGDQPAGTYKVNFNGSDLSSGVYFYRLQANNFVSVKKFTLMK